MHDRKDNTSRQQTDDRADNTNKTTAITVDRQMYVQSSQDFFLAQTERNSF